MPRPSSWTLPSLELHTHLNSCTPSGFHSKMSVTTVYAFLPNKCQDTYRELLQSIVDNCHASNPQLDVQTIITDLRCSPSCSYSCIWSPHQPPGLFLPPDTSIMAKDTTAWFGASLQQRRRLQTVLWYDGWSCLFTSN